MDVSVGFSIDLRSKKLDWFHNDVHSSFVLFLQRVPSCSQSLEVALF